MKRGKQIKPSQRYSRDMPQYHYSPSLEVNSRKEIEANKKAWQQNAASLPDNAFADDVRLGEAAGLLKEDIKLDDRIPHIDLKPHPLRTLKTKGSQRLIPLTKEALWASKRLLETNNDSMFAFPR